MRVWPTPFAEQTMTSSLFVFFWVIPRRPIYICRRFGTLYLFHLQRQVWSDTRVWGKVNLYWRHTGNHPKENKQHSEHGESLKSRMTSSVKSEDRQSNKIRKSRSHHKEKTLYLHYKTNRLMMFKKIVFFYFKNRTKHTLNEKMTYSAKLQAVTLVTEWFH